MKIAPAKVCVEQGEDRTDADTRSKLSQMESTCRLAAAGSVRRHLDDGRCARRLLDQDAASVHRREARACRRARARAERSEVLRLLRRVACELRRDVPAHLEPRRL